MKQVNDNKDYSKPQINVQDSVTLSWSNVGDYNPSSVAVRHGLGFVPIALAYFSTQPSFDLDDFIGVQMPFIEFGGPSGAIAQVYYSLDKEYITFTRQSFTTTNATTGTYYIKYFLFAQPTSA